MHLRPNTFTLDATNKLAQGLVFAGLGFGSGASTMYDSSRLLNHGTLTNMTPASDWVFVPELGRWALDCDGTNDSVFLPLSTISSISTSVSVFTWAKPSALTVDQRAFAAGTSGAVTDENSWALWMDTDGAGDGWAAGTYSPAGTKIIGVDSVNATTDWQHVGFTWGDGYLRVYVNGTESASVAGSGTLNTPTQITYGKIFGDGTGSGANFAGQLADGLVYNRVLAQSQIADLADPSNVYLSGLIAGRPRRRYFLPPAPTFSAAWALKTNNLIGGGVG